MILHADFVQYDDNTVNHISNSYYCGPYYNAAHYDNGDIESDNPYHHLSDIYIRDRYFM